MHPVFARATRTGKLDVKFLEKIDVFVCLSEKEVAALGFPNLEGKLDYVGFKSANASVLEWATALYAHYWGKASPQIPDQLITP
jgi:predicted transcriptional regulator